jgi:aspartyl-tRNA(Asn)/glutamyl-tRNA(Gln) amidotransferase subunit C
MAKGNPEAPALSDSLTSVPRASLAEPDQGWSAAPEFRALSRLRRQDIAGLPQASTEARMSVDPATVRRVAHLARIHVTDEEVESLRGELNAILGFVEQLNEVDVAGVEPMTSVRPMAMRRREDRVTDGGIAADIVANAPQTEDHYFLVPKVVE